MKRIVFSLLLSSLFAFFLSSGASSVFAQATCDPTSPYNDQNTACFGQAQDQAREQGVMNNEAYIHTVNQNMAASLACQIGGIGCTIQEGEQAMHIQNSLLGFASQGLSATFLNPPASTYAFLRDSAESLGFVPKQTYAQGIGFSGLSPLLPIWKVFRNISYAVLAIVMIVIGFMIMMRQKIDPKTVVTVQNALPKVVLALILITFSYAIVGIMIDIMYLIIYVTIALISSTGMLPPITDLVKSNILHEPIDSLQTLYIRGSIMDNITHLFGPTPFKLPGFANPSLSSAFDLIYKIFNGGNTGPVSNTTMLAGAGLIGALIAGLTGNVPAALILGIGGVGIPPLVGLLLSLAILFLIIRLAIFFIGAYIQIILALVFAPLQILLEAIPGNNSFENWMKNLIANMIVFPIGALVFMLAAIFLQMSNAPSQSLWYPPFTAFFAGNQAIGALLAIGVLFALTDIAGQVQAALKPKPFINAGASGFVSTLMQPAGLAMTGINMVTSLSTAMALRRNNPIAQAPPEEHKPHKP